MIALLLAVLALAEPVDDFRGHLDQARFYARKGWTQDALTEVELAVASPDGRLVAETWLLAAALRLEVGDVGGAVEAAGHARSTAAAPEEVEAAALLEEDLLLRFGRLRLTGPSGRSFHLDLEPAGPLLDPGAAVVVEQVAATLAGPVDLPMELWLPVGPWRVGERTIRVIPGRAVVVLRREDLGSAELSTEAVEIHTAISAGGQLGWEARQTLPGVGLEVGAVVDVGLIGLRGSLSWRPSLWRTPDSATRLDAATGHLAVDALVPLTERGGTRLILEAGWRVGRAVGVTRTCDASGASCDRDEAGALVVAPGSWMQGPSLGVSVDHLASADAWLRPGLALVVAPTFGALPAQGRVRSGSGEDLTFSVAEGARSWYATDVHVVLRMAIRP